MVFGKINLNLFGQTLIHFLYNRTLESFIGFLKKKLLF